MRAGPMTGATDPVFDSPMANWDMEQARAQAGEAAQGMRAGPVTGMPEAPGLLERLYANPTVVPYDEGTQFDPMSGVPLTSDVSGAPVDSHTTGNMWEDLTLSDAARDQLNDIRRRTAEADGTAPVEVQTPDENTPRPKPRPEVTTDPAAAIAGGNSGGGSGGSGGGGGGGSGGGTSYEQAIADALARADKRANQDKWLAVAQAGMALMASKQPTLGGALGEAGLAGVGAYRSSRDEAEKTKMDLLGTQFEIDLARQKLAASRAGGGGGGGGFSYNQYATRLGDYAELLADDLSTMVDGMGNPIPARMDDYERTMAELQQVRDQQRTMLGLPVIAGAEDEVDDVTQ